ncbi:hypothetical protein GOV12_02065 [Candidatus Pacearchaeota archaeon]|nr:hypothetical protein [Candidatus Pacearchaeota archaeon]
MTLDNFANSEPIFDYIDGNKVVGYVIGSTITGKNELELYVFDVENQEILYKNTFQLPNFQPESLINDHSEYMSRILTESAAKTYIPTIANITNNTLRDMGVGVISRKNLHQAFVRCLS